MKLILALVLLVAVTRGIERPEMSPVELQNCPLEGGCIYMSHEWLTQQLTRSREQGRREAEVQCGARAGLSL